VKYEAPKGKPPHAYFPPGVGAALRDASRPLVIVEGEKKAAACLQAGFPCVGLAGVYSWQRKRKSKGEPRRLIPDLESPPWQGRLVTILSDSDLADKSTVQWAAYHLALALQAQGAIVRVARIPHGPGGAKWGADDFLLARGADALRELLAVAGEPERPQDGR